MTNKELVELLSQYPEDAELVIEYCNPESLQYDEKTNLIIIN